MNTNQVELVVSRAEEYSPSFCFAELFQDGRRVHITGEYNDATGARAEAYKVARIYGLSICNEVARSC